jgi:putative transcriptional regulator
MTIHSGHAGDEIQISVERRHLLQTLDRHEGYLEGKLLVATPLVAGDCFQHSVVYLFAHNPHGAMGVIVNKPLEMVHFASLFQQLGIPVTGKMNDLPIYHGGPVEEHRGFVLHSPDYKGADTLVSRSGIAITASTSVLRDIAAGSVPVDRLLTIGYARWAPGQLESEIEANSWITVPATPELVFHAEDDAKWLFAAKSLGVDMDRYSTFSGRA